MSSTPDLATRIRDARNAAGLTQQQLATKVGTDIRTVQNWESGRTPRDIGMIERALAADLRSPPDSAAPPLDEASDAQWLSEGATRLANRDRELRELRRQLDDANARIADLLNRLDHTPTGVTESPFGSAGGNRWAARENHDPQPNRDIGR